MEDVKVHRKAAKKALDQQQKVVDQAQADYDAAVANVTLNPTSTDLQTAKDDAYNTLLVEQEVLAAAQEEYDLQDQAFSDAKDMKKSTQEEMSQQKKDFNTSTSKQLQAVKDAAQTATSQEEFDASTVQENFDNVLQTTTDEFQASVDSKKNETAAIKSNSLNARSNAKAKKETAKSNNGKANGKNKDTTTTDDGTTETTTDTTTETITDTTTETSGKNNNGKSSAMMQTQEPTSYFNSLYFSSVAVAAFAVYAVTRQGKREDDTVYNKV